jgi:hypothetical protein
MKPPQAKMRRQFKNIWGRLNEFMKQLKRFNEVMNLFQCENGKTLPVLLFVLLLLVAGGGCLYYFTDLIVKHGHENEPVISNASLVKKPMPPRSEISEGINREKSTIASQQTVANSNARPGAGKPAPAKISKQNEITPTRKAKKQVAIKTGTEEKLEKLTTARQIAKNVPESKSSSTAKKLNKAKESEYKHEETKMAKQSVKPANGRFTLLIGVYVMKKSMAPEKSKLKSVGLKPEIVKGPKMMQPMNRLFVGRFNSYAEAALETKKISKATKDTFILPENGKFALYAGSYFEKGRALSEYERLAKAGLKTEIVRKRVPVTTFRLTAGCFASRELALKEAQHLKKVGLDASVIGSGI